MIVDTVRFCEHPLPAMYRGVGDADTAQAHARMVAGHLTGSHGQVWASDRIDELARFLTPKPEPTEAQHLAMARRLAEIVNGR